MLATLPKFVQYFCKIANNKEENETKIYREKFLIIIFKKSCKAQIGEKAYQHTVFPLWKRSKHEALIRFPLYFQSAQADPLAGYLWKRTIFLITNAFSSTRQNGARRVGNNTTLLSLCREICLVIRHLNKTFILR